MTPSTSRSFILSRPAMATRRHDLPECEVALRRMRRRLLRFILENHRQRISERGLSQQPAGRTA
jgi:hypothetical protein